MDRFDEGREKRVPAPKFAFIKQNTILRMFIDVPNHTNHGDRFDARDTDTLNIGRTHLTKTLGQTQTFDLVEHGEELFGTVRVHAFHRLGLNPYEFRDQDVDVQNVSFGVETEPRNRILFCSPGHLVGASIK